MYKRPVPVMIAVALLALLAGCADADGASAGGPLRKELLGKWKVTGVIAGGLDPEKGATYVPYRGDDARLAGRFFSFGEGTIAADTPENPRCSVTGATTKRTTLKAITAASLKGEGWTAPADDAKSFGITDLTSSDLGGGISQDTGIDVTQVECDSGRFGKELGNPRGLEGAWMVLFPNGRLAIRWYDETVLVLERVPADAKPKPSFDCAKAATAPEKAICGSLELASLDATIAERYRESIEDASNPGSRLTPPVAEIKKLQRDWLKQRNACGGDAECLRRSMEGRLKEEYRIVEVESE